MYRARMHRESERWKEEHKERNYIKHIYVKNIVPSDGLNREMFSQNSTL